MKVFNKILNQCERDLASITFATYAIVKYCFIKRKMKSFEWNVEYERDFTSIIFATYGVKFLIYTKFKGFCMLHLKLVILLN